MKPPPTDARMLTVDSATGHNLQPVDVINCVVTIGGISKAHSFFIFKLMRDLFIGLDMKQIYRVGCGWTTEDKLYLHQWCHVIVNSLNVNVNKLKLQKLNYLQIPTQTIATILAKKTGPLLQTPVVCKVIVNDQLITQFPQLSVPVTVHMKEEVDPCHVPCTSLNLFTKDVVLQKHMVIVSLEPLGESSIEKEILNLLVNAEDESKLQCTPDNVQFVWKLPFIKSVSGRNSAFIPPGVPIWSYLW